MGELPSGMNEQDIIQIWSLLGYSVNVKLIREKSTQKALYCFVEFDSPQLAEQALQYNQSQVTFDENEFVLKLGWATNQAEYSLFVGDIPQMNDQQLMEIFKYYNCTNAKVVIDPQTQHTKGYGFVRFSSEADQQKALKEMNGVIV
jgi:RNA recognition motif-containing protein